MVNQNNQIKISAETRRSVFNKIMSHADFMGVFHGVNYEDQNIVDFLKLIWDLPAMPSEDHRYKNAEADARQHLINNDDWDLTYTFEQRFNLLAGDIKYFVKFVETCVSPFVRASSEEIMQYVKEINPLLNKDKCELAIEDYIDEKPHFIIKSGTGFTFERKDINSNRYTIYVDKLGDNKPCFFLESIIWDDYGHKTSFNLSYIDKDGNYLNVGNVKICKKNENKTIDVIPKSFLSLDSNYCSLGQDTSYYSNIKRRLREDAMAFLYAMRDAAAFSRISDDFENDSGFRHSLLRDNNADIALNLGRYVLAGFDPDERVNFTYNTQLAYAPDFNFNIKFDFGRINQEDNFNRVIAIIGENGVGKTSLLSNLAKSIANQQKDCFLPHYPMFTKVVAASYSIFDKFYDIDARAFNFEYCGMHNNEGGLMDLEQLKARHKRNAETINALNRGLSLKKFLDNILPNDMLESLFEKDRRETKFKYDVYEDYYGKMSSGQTMLTNLIIDITANVRSNCLIMIDEPEVHLHPNAITQIINVVNLVCDRFSSCCIMATHSPLVIQSLLSRNVLIMERDIDGMPVIRQMRIESLGENLTTINEEIFSNGQRDKYYRQLIKMAVEGKDSMEEVLQELQNGDLPMSLTSYMLIDKYLKHD